MKTWGTSGQSGAYNVGLIHYRLSLNENYKLSGQLLYGNMEISIFHAVGCHPIPFNGKKKNMDSSTVGLKESGWWLVSIPTLLSLLRTGGCKNQINHAWFLPGFNWPTFSGPRHIVNIISPTCEVSFFGLWEKCGIQKGKPTKPPTPLLLTLATSVSSHPDIVQMWWLWGGGLEASLLTLDFRPFQARLPLSSKATKGKRMALKKW